MESKAELYREISRLEMEVDKHRTQLTEVRELLTASQVCLKEAKRRWATTTTNSDADVAIARNDAFLNPTEANGE